MASTLRLAVDGTPLLGPQTGVARVTDGLLEGLAGREDLEVVVYAVTWRGRDRLQTRVPATVTPATSPIPAQLTRALWMRSDVPRIERWTGRVDVVHGTCFVGPPSRAPVVVTIHDLTFVHFPELCDRPTLQFDRLVRRALDRGATVHAVSDFVADEVRTIFDVPADRVVRIYAGLAPSGHGDACRGQQVARAERYVLALGMVEPRKNLPTLVRAFDEAAAHDRDLHLVIAGPDGWGVDEFDRTCAAAHHRDRIRRLGFVSEDHRRDLLSGATVFAYPSRYEGFGHPPLEAMSAGVPVVAARAGALPEVLGDAAVLVEPTDVEGLAEALGRLAGDDELRARLRRLGRARAERYTWARATNEFVSLYQAVT